MPEHTPFCGRCFDCEAVKGIPEAFSGDVAPDCAKLLWLRRQQRIHRCDTGLVKPIFHSFADAGNIFERQLGQRLRHIFRTPNRQAVRLLRGACNLSQMPIGGKSD